jgi:hypothetical protein
MRIRPIQPAELPVFAGAATHSEHVGAVHDYVSDLLIKGLATAWVLMRWPASTATC